jgi:ribosome biogenesis protein Nip4
MIGPLKDFIRLFDASLTLDEGPVEKKENRYFLMNENLKRFINKDFLYAGTYLGETKGGSFVPSFMFLAMIAKTAQNKTYVDQKTEWLFICGRDVFRQGIARTTGAAERNDYTLIMNSFDECLGFGRIIADLSKSAKGVAVKNALDIGDFLRRER